MAVAGALVLSAGAPAFADDDGGAPRATLTCERADSPGRVRCEVEARVAPGESIAWGDVALVRVPPFAAALRGRIGPNETTLRETDAWRWAFALVAREKGAGEVEGHVRVVACRKTCAPWTVTVVGRLVVGE